METVENIREKLLEILSDYVNENGEYIVEFIDSLEFIQVVLSIENEFGVEFDDDMLTLESLTDVNQLASYIAEKESV
ncbi:phosphopantetheine-binding protein [Bacillus thuringiensis]|uniref:phosphopantetheine-binding protein n=1 Tax=Bacillus thuringiensis TaxID=1428 RepID=UPI000A3B91B0|nr:phosphopantetheine-binding protein [Bacillus thuringiensis]OUA56161.1 phosphopantetheine-containing protein [Bacillus thuringiensis serovar aizawai]